MKQSSMNKVASMAYFSCSTSDTVVHSSSIFGPRRSPDIIRPVACFPRPSSPYKNQMDTATKSERRKKLLGIVSSPGPRVPLQLPARTTRRLPPRPRPLRRVRTTAPWPSTASASSCTATPTTFVAFAYVVMLGSQRHQEIGQ